MGNQKGPRPGFDYSASFIGQGQYNDCPFEIDGKPTPTKGWVDAVSTDFAIQWIKQNHDKPIAIGHKNWLFFGSDRGGQTLAVLASFTATCGQLGINPWTYLRDTLTALPTKPKEELAKVLPVKPADIANG